ncbi:hypothetical protein Sa4125_33090 [Aureimonas sp. SA4125]|uniref:type II toxin-antitoxin system ParD family antitoxin n=1 Tax=Aureimonas sp. SA4125 TaxID=2826993 RepID=UPI001CC345CD|nr:type II toxin-antitoxin system ParD family antitoxin [Aureimonas sp. SA4125]BDA85767.1 hypothetical protein Sa4125_33090 [Aureimonas sp. SA4125]
MPAVEKITIALTAEMAGYVRDVVGAGQYASASEAIREAVREWQERRDLLGYTVEELRALVDAGIASGPALDAAEVFTGIREKVRTGIPVRP